MNVVDLAKSIKDYIRDKNNNFICPGDLVSINYKIPRYFIAEYAKIGSDKMILLLHSKCESYHVTSLNLFYALEKRKTSGNWSNIDSVFQDSLKGNLQLVVDYLNTKNVFLEKIENKKVMDNWYKKIQRGVLYRKNWGSYPSVYLVNAFFGSGSIYSMKNASQSAIYLQNPNNENHIEYIWLQRKFN